MFNCFKLPYVTHTHTSAPYLPGAGIGLVLEIWAPLPPSAFPFKEAPGEKPPGLHPPRNGSFSVLVGVLRLACLEFQPSAAASLSPCSHSRKVPPCCSRIISIWGLKLWQDRVMCFMVFYFTRGTDGRKREETKRTFWIQLSLVNRGRGLISFFQRLWLFACLN